VRSNWLLKFINTVIGIVALAAGWAVWWFGWRPLPQTSGTVAAPVRSAVTVQRDERGLPRIEAATLEDLLFAQGYVTAQDRLWHMESLRRAANGTLAEVVGPGALDLDRETRSYRIARIAERQLAKLSAADYAALAAFARGVNHFIRERRGNYPVEFRLLAFDPRPWRVEDTLGIGLLMFRTLSNTGRMELQKAVMLAKGDREKVEYLFGMRGGEDIQPGSNAWALAPSRTASGRALLANDPHLQHGIPGTWYPVQLRGGGLAVSGMTIPGIPGVIVGRNERIAWGITNLGFDVQDYYL
jgi:penicillin amidase